MSYEWLKVIHILAVFSWMAGLFYLPRLMVYHVDKAVGSESDLTFKSMERRLVAAIMRPSAVVTLLSGFGLVWWGGLLPLPVWLWVKLVAVLTMVVFHGVLERYVVLLGSGWRGHSSRFFRFLNEVPTILLIVIVVSVVVRPFS